MKGKQSAARIAGVVGAVKRIGSATALIVFTALPVIAVDYYVATTGLDTNNGLTLTSAWRKIGKALRVGGMPDGTIGNPNTLYVQPGVYESETTGLTAPSGRTNWYLNFYNRQYINVIGAGPTQTILTPGDKTLYVTKNNDIESTRPLFCLNNCKGVRISGFYVNATTPSAWVDGVAGSYPEMSAIVGINGCSDVRIDHMYINGVYTGMVFNVANNSWQKSWQGWWFHGLCINGILGPGIQIDHILMRGFVRSVYNNNFGSSSPANTNIVQIDHCTFVENVCVSDVTQVVNVRVLPSEYGPSFEIRNCIISDHPLPSFTDSTSSAGLLAQSTNSLSNPNFTVSSQSNQYWAVGKPIPGTNYKNNNIIDSRPAHTDYENEQPVFIEHNGLPYSTERETAYGTRDVGWSVIDVATMPFVAVTSMPATVSCDVTTYIVSGTNNINVVGIMGWSNTATMVMGALLAALDWSVGGIDLAVGTNTIVVYGTNIYGDIASDHIAVLRGVPFVDITNVTPCTVGYANATTVIGGTNNQNVVGVIRWQNLTGGTAGDATRVGDAWTALITGLLHGDNTVQVIGTNVLAQQSSDSIVVHRKTTAEAMPQIASNALIFPSPAAVLSAPLPTNVVWWASGIADDEDGTNVTISRISVHVSNTLVQAAVVTNTIGNVIGLCGWLVPESLAGGGTTYVMRFEVTDSSGLTNSMVFNGNAFTIVPEGASAAVAALVLASRGARKRQRHLIAVSRR